MKFLKWFYSLFFKKTPIKGTMEDLFKEMTINEDMDLCDQYPDKKDQMRIRPLTKYEKRIAISYLAKSPSVKSPIGKAEVIKELWGGKIPGYFWFDMGVKIGEDAVEDLQSVIDIFFPDKRPGFGDIEFHGSNSHKTTLMRIRNAQRLQVSPIIEGKERYLDLVGYGDFEGKQVNFWRLHYVKDIIEKGVGLSSQEENNIIDLNDLNDPSCDFNYIANHIEKNI